MDGGHLFFDGKRSGIGAGTIRLARLLGWIHPPQHEAANDPELLLTWVFRSNVTGHSGPS